MTDFINLFYNVIQVFFSTAFVTQIFLIALVGLAFVAIIFNLFSRKGNIL